jgi:hypothetical protein
MYLCFIFKPFEVKPWKAQATNPYEQGLQSVVLSVQLIHGVANGDDHRAMID